MPHSFFVTSIYATSLARQFAKPSKNSLYEFDPTREKKVHLVILYAPPMIAEQCQSKSSIKRNECKTKRLRRTIILQLSATLKEGEGVGEE